MARLPEGVYPQARALNYGNRGRSISVSVTTPDGTTQSVRAVASNNINATRCCVVVDADGRAVVINPADTGRVENKRTGRFVYGRPATAQPVRREQEQAIAWWQFTWKEFPFGDGLLSADPDPLELYLVIDSGTGRVYVQHQVAIVDVTAPATVTIEATKITAVPTSSLIVYTWFSRDETAYPAPTPGSYPNPSDEIAFLGQLPIFSGLGSFDDIQTATVTSTIAINVPAGRSVIEVIEDSGLTVFGTAPTPLWSITATVA